MANTPHPDQGSDLSGNAATSVARPISGIEGNLGMADKNLERSLQNRHIQLIAIGGAIGTGLFMGSGKTIATAGPAILFVYLLIGAALFVFMRAMGELLLANTSGSFADLATQLIGPWAGFVVGWSYWLTWVVTGVADMVAIVGYSRFWWADIPAWIPVVLTVALLITLNAMTVKAFGEIEFWFALVKILAIVSLIIVGIWMVFRGQINEAGTAAAVSNLWNHGGMFPHGASGFIAAFPLAIFAFSGIELVGTTVAETKDPEVTLPKAINSIPVRIMLFYVLAMAAIMMVTPWNQIDPEKSPFVTMFALTGLGAAATVVNIVVLSSAASSANSGIYSTSRMLWGLAHQGSAPELFGVLSRRRVPLNALFLSCVLLLTSIVLLLAGDSVLGAFTMVTAMSATLFMVTWAFILVAYLRHLKQNPEAHQKSTFKSPGGAVGAWLVLAFLACMVVILSIEAETRIGLIATAVWMVGITVVARRSTKNHPNAAAHHA